MNNYPLDTYHGTEKQELLEEIENAKLEAKRELMRYLIEEAAKDLSEMWRVKMRDWLSLKSPVENIFVEK